jgi:Leucine-rich repeat (LRR) protein
MQVSHKYFIRASAFHPFPPISKDQVTDALFRQIIGIIGGHQLVIDISRCKRLSQSIFSQLILCRGLQFLDLSWTSFTDLSILSELSGLKSLILSGNKLSNLSDIKFLPQLELVSLRYTDIESLLPLSNVYGLRSLDIGHCYKLLDIEGLACCTRLEELIMDSAAKRVNPEAFLSHCENIFSNLKELRFLSIHGTKLEQYKEEILSSLDINICLQIESREYLFFKAVIEDNIDEVRLYVESGFDIDLRAGK